MLPTCTWYQYPNFYEIAIAGKKSWTCVLAKVGLSIPFCNGKDAAFYICWSKTIKCFSYGNQCLYQILGFSTIIFRVEEQLKCNLSPSLIASHLSAGSSLGKFNVFEWRDLEYIKNSA